MTYVWEAFNLLLKQFAQFALNGGSFVFIQVLFMHFFFNIRKKIATNLRFRKKILVVNYFPINYIILNLKFIQIV